MNKDQIVTIFKKYYSKIESVILNIAVWSNEPAKDMCKTVSEALTVLSNAGEKRAAALYCFVAAFDNNGDTFNKSLAIKLISDLDAFDEYSSLVKEYCEESPWPPEDYDYFCSFPFIGFLENVANDNSIG